MKKKMVWEEIMIDLVYLKCVIFPTDALRFGAGSSLFILSVLWIIT